MNDLKAVGEHPSAGLREFVAEVLSQSDEDLTALLRRVLVVDGRTDGFGIRLAEEIKEKLHLDPQNASNIFRSLLGWLQDVVMESWRSGRDALVHRESFGKQIRFLQIRFQSQQLFRETAAALVPVKEEDRKVVCQFES